MRGNGLKLHQGVFQLDIRNYFFIPRVAKHWCSLSREMVECWSLKVFKKCVDLALGTWSNSEHGGDTGLTVGLDDLKDVFQI